MHGSVSKFKCLTHNTSLHHMTAQGMMIKGNRSLKLLGGSNHPNVRTIPNAQIAQQNTPDDPQHDLGVSPRDLPLNITNDINPQVDHVPIALPPEDRESNSTVLDENLSDDLTIYFHNVKSFEVREHEVNNLVDR